MVVVVREAEAREVAAMAVEAAMAVGVRRRQRGRQGWWRCWSGMFTLPDGRPTGLLYSPKEKSLIKCW